MLSGESNQNGERTTIGLISNSCYEKMILLVSILIKKHTLGYLLHANVFSFSFKHMIVKRH